MVYCCAIEVDNLNVVKEIAGSIQADGHLFSLLFPTLLALVVCSHASLHLQKYLACIFRLSLIFWTNISE
jgi:hypothetical protein